MLSRRASSGARRPGTLSLRHTSGGVMAFGIELGAYAENENFLCRGNAEPHIGLSRQACQKNQPIRLCWTRDGIFLSQRSVSVRSRAEVIITHTPSTSDACEMHVQPVEKSISSLALLFC